MTETTRTAYDPIPDLAWLLGAAQRQADGYEASGGIRTYAKRLVEGLRLPELATAAEAYVAISSAIAPHSVAKGDIITIVPEHGRSRRMLVSHVEHHIITLADLDECPIEAVFGGGDEERYPCTYAKGHDGPHSFAHPNTYPPSVADLAARERAGRIDRIMDEELPPLTEALERLGEG